VQNERKINIINKKRIKQQSNQQHPSAENRHKKQQSQLKSD